MSRRRWESGLSAVSLCGQGIAYVLGLMLARYLGVEGFETYVVASAAFILMVTFVPQGFEKYSLKVIPPLLDRGEHAPLRGYLRFACRRILLGSLIVGLAVAACVLLASGLPAALRTALLISCLALPAGALVHLGLEVLTAFGRPLPAALVFRIVVPGLVLAFAGATMMLGVGLRATWAIGAWSVSWVVALGLMAREMRRTAPARPWTGPAIEHRAFWASQARPFWMYRIALALMAQAGIVALELLRPSASAVGAFAAALATASVAQVLATATNRVYASRLSLLLEQGDMRGIHHLRMQRLRWLALPLLAFLIAMLLFAPRIIGLFRPEFVGEGAAALRILAVATVFSTLLSMAPTYLKHRGANPAVFRSVAIAAALQLLLLPLLIPRYGAMGAALAHAIATTFMYGNLARLAHVELQALRRN